MRTMFIKELTKLAIEDPRIWLLTADLGYSVLEQFEEAVPDRYMNVGVAEQNLAGMAAGIAHCGNIPFIYSIANFPTMRCLEQIRNDMCYHGYPVRIVSVGGGFSYGSQGYTHHGVEDFAVMRSLLGMTVIAPCDPVETKALIEQSMHVDTPVYFRLGKAGEPLVHPEDAQIQLGRAAVVRNGTDLTFIAIGAIVKHAQDVAEYMAVHDGINIRVLSMHTLKPLDKEAVLKAAKETQGIVTIEEHSITGGLGSAVAEVLAEDCEDKVSFQRYGLADQKYSLIGDQKFLRECLLGDLRQKSLKIMKNPIVFTEVKINE